MNNGRQREYRIAVSFAGIKNAYATVLVTHVHWICVSNLFWLGINVVMCCGIIWVSMYCVPGGGGVGGLWCKLFGVFEEIAGFHLTSLKFKLQSYWSSWDFTLMIYKSSWKLIFVQIFAPNGFLILWFTTLEFLSFAWLGICITA